MDLDHERRLTEVEDRAKSNSRRLDEVEKRQDNLDKLVSTVQVLASDQKHIEGDVREIKDNVKTLMSKPAKRWEFVVEKALYFIVAAILGFALASIGFSV